MHVRAPPFRWSHLHRSRRKSGLVLDYRWRSEDALPRLSFQALERDREDERGWVSETIARSQGHDNRAPPVTRRRWATRRARQLIPPPESRRAGGLSISWARASPSWSAVYLLFRGRANKSAARI